MQASRKQQIYAEVLLWVLPMLRNRETWPWWRRLRSWYPEAELVHNLHDKLLEPSFTDSDLHWLNTQARIFVDRGGRAGCHGAVAPLIAELFRLVPADLQGRLTWTGPSNPPLQPTPPSRRG